MIRRNKQGRGVINLTVQQQFLNQEQEGRVSDSYPMISQPTPGGKRINQPTNLSHICYQLIFILFSPIFRLPEIVFIDIPYICSILYTNCSTLFQPIQQPNVLAHLENLSHMLSSSHSTVFQVTNNILTSTINKSFNRCKKSIDFQIITKRSIYRSISLYSNSIYDIFIVD